MPRIRCRYGDCVFLEESYCGAAAIELDPDAGCLTYSRVDDLAPEKEVEDWEDEEVLDEDEWEEEEDLYDDEDDDWDDDEY